MPAAVDDLVLELLGVVDGGETTLHAVRAGRPTVIDFCAAPPRLLAQHSGPWALQPVFPILCGGAISRPGILLRVVRTGRFFLFEQTGRFFLFERAPPLRGNENTPTRSGDAPSGARGLIRRIETAVKRTARTRETHLSVPRTRLAHNPKSHGPCLGTTRCERCPAALTKLDEMARDVPGAVFISVCLGDDKDFANELVDEKRASPARRVLHAFRF